MLRRTGAAFLALFLSIPSNAAPVLGRTAGKGLSVAPNLVPATPHAAAFTGAEALGAPSLISSLPSLDAFRADPRTAALATPAAALPAFASVRTASPRLSAVAAKPSPAKRTLVKRARLPVLASLKTLTRETAPSRAGASVFPHFFDLAVRYPAAAAPVSVEPRRPRTRGSLTRTLARGNLADDTPPSPAAEIPRGWGFGGWAYIGYLSAVIAGLAVYSPIFPGMAIERFGAASYGLAASLAVLAMPPAAALARKAGNAFGMQRALAASLIGAGAASAALFSTLGGGALPWAGLAAGLIVVQGMFASMRTLDKAIPAGLYGRDQEKLQRFNALSFSLSRIPGILLPLVLAPMLRTVGLYGTLSVFPIALIAAAPLVLSIKSRLPESDAAENPERRGDPALLRLSGWGFASQQVMTYVLPFILASGYGSYAFPGDPLAAKAVAGMLFGAWTVGVLLGTFHLMGFFRGALARFAMSPRTLSPVESMRRSAWIGAIGFAGFIPLLWPFAPALYAGAVLAGFSGGSSFLVYLSAAQANAPSQDRAGAISRYMTLSFAAIAGIVWGMGALLQAFPGSPVPFAFLIAVLGGFSALNAAIALRLNDKETP